MLEVIQKPFAYYLRFNWNKAIIDDIKAIKPWQDRSYVPEEKMWSVSIERKNEVLQIIEKHGGKLIEQTESEKIGDIPPMPELNIEIATKIELRHYQKQGVAYGLEKKRFINGDKPGLGKQNPLYSLIATPNGFVKMGDLIIGQSLFGCDGNIYNVTGIFPQGVMDIYEVEFNDGSISCCGLEHLWKIRDHNRRSRNQGWIVKPLSFILKWGVLSKSSKKREESGRKPILKWEIPVCDPVKYSEKEYLIHPYLLGVMLGDGSLGRGITISIPDSEIETLDRITNLIPEYMKFAQNRSGACPNYRLVQKVTTKNNPFIREVQKLKLNVHGKDKFIPEIYLQGSVEQRMDLLRGLMDSDGSAKKNRITFHSKSKSLVDSVVMLVNSLGGQAIVRPYDRTHQNKGIEYQLNVRVKFIPFYLKRKAAQYDIKKVNYCSRYIKEVRYKAKEECQCISVSAPDNLYLTDHYIVTHNTAEAIATIFAAQAFPVLCIVPASLRDNWVKEWNKVVGIKAMILEDRVKKTWPTFYTVGMCNVFITSYDSLEKYFVEKINKDEKGKWKISNVVFNKNKDIFKAVIMDEIQKIKDSKTRAAKLTAGICFQKEYRIGLSGTPILNTPKDLVSQLKTIGQLEAVGGSYKYFINRYCGGDGKGATNLKELNYRLKTACFFQRTTEEVLTELPPKIYQNVYCDITTRKEYNIALNDLSSYLKDFKDKTAREISISMRGEVMVKIGILKQISARGKMEAVTEYIEDLLGAGEKVGLFVHHAEVADFIKGKFPQTLLYTGRQSSAEKNMAVEQFQKCKSCGVMFEDHKGLDHEHEMSDKRLITISTKAGGVGLTLTAARNMGVVELPWHPADCEQIEARFWRMSQTNNVKCTYFLGRNTIDEHIYDIIERKRGVVNAVMGLDDNRQFVDKEEKNLVDNIIKLFNDGKMNIVQ